MVRHLWSKNLFFASSNGKLSVLFGSYCISLRKFRFSCPIFPIKKEFLFQHFYTVFLHQNSSSFIQSAYNFMTGCKERILKNWD